MQLRSMTRRRFLARAATASPWLMARPATTLAGGPGARPAVKVASNQGAENATLQQLMHDRGYGEHDDHPIGGDQRVDRQEPE